MVLAAIPIGEYDKRVVILTKERGKISVFAKGARKPSSALGGSIIPFSFGEFTIYEGRTSYTLMSASISNYFTELKEDMEGAYYGFYFMEIADYYCREANDETQMLKLLYQSLRALVNESIPNLLVRYIYELKAICLNGEAPQVFQCVACGNKERQGQFSVRKGGRVCCECDRDVFDGIKLDVSTWYALQYIVGAKVERLYTFTVSDLVLRELGMVIGRYMDVYVDKRFKSLEILEQMT
ncbi:MAG: DNA repair protein RecO [Eubacteriales bacterium]|nr:DNA repair protein RecO [Eubacteriales bacterium]